MKSVEGFGFRFVDEKDRYILRKSLVHSTYDECLYTYTSNVFYIRQIMKRSRSSQVGRGSDGNTYAVKHRQPGSGSNGKSVEQYDIMTGASIQVSDGYCTS